ncbi:hypothetical protein T492DRAFT_959253, partial [Pavlovales sp. CCMP2436]
DELVLELDAMRSRLVALEVSRKRAQLEALVEGRPGALQLEPAGPPHLPTTPIQSHSMVGAGDASSCFVTATSEATFRFGAVGPTTHVGAASTDASGEALAVARKRELGLVARTRDLEGQLHALGQMLGEAAGGCPLCAERPRLDQLLLELLAELTVRVDGGLKLVASAGAQHATGSSGPFSAHSEETPATTPRASPTPAVGANFARARRKQLLDSLLVHQRLQALLGDTRATQAAAGGTGARGGGGRRAGGWTATDGVPAPPAPPTLAEQAQRPPPPLHLSAAALAAAAVRSRAVGGGVGGSYGGVSGSLSARQPREARRPEALGGSLTARAARSGCSGSAGSSSGARGQQPAERLDHAWAERMAWHAQAVQARGEDVGVVAAALRTRAS